MRFRRRRTISVLVVCAMILCMFYTGTIHAVSGSGRAGQMYRITCDNPNVIIAKESNRDQSIEQAQEGDVICISPQTGFAIVETPNVETSDIESKSVEQAGRKAETQEAAKTNPDSIEITSDGDGGYRFIMPAAAVTIVVRTRGELPTASPSETPVSTPTATPVNSPSTSPSAAPSETPGEFPSATPAGIPTISPSAAPSETPAASPVSSPTSTPGEFPSATPAGTPTISPSAAPSETPAASPVSSPISTPAGIPTISPSATPAGTPTISPSAAPSETPGEFPTASPVSSPTSTPAGIPTISPSATPAGTPTISPSAAPSETPGEFPTATPGTEPTTSPSGHPTVVPSTSPTVVPQPSFPAMLPPSTAPSQTPGVKSRLTISKTSMSLYAYCKVKSNPKKGIYVPAVHAKEKIKASYDSKDYTVRYSSSNSKVASVDKNGVVKGVKMGKATITVFLYKKNDTKKACESRTVSVTVKPTIYMNYLTGKKYVLSGGKKFTNKRGIRFCIVGADKPFYLFYQSGKKKYTVYANKKWKKNTGTVPVRKKTWIPLSGKSYKFFVGTDKNRKSVFNSNVIVWKI